MVPKSQGDRAQRKREQNKLSQRIHRARKAARIAELEEEVRKLRKQIQRSNYNEENLRLRRLLVGVCNKVKDTVNAVEAVEQMLGTSILNDRVQEVPFPISAIESPGFDTALTLGDEIIENEAQGFLLNAPELDNEKGEKKTDFHILNSSPNEGIREHITTTYNPQSPATNPENIWLEFKYPASYSIPGALSVNPSFYSLEHALRCFTNGFARSITKLESITTSDCCINPRVLTLVTMYAEEFLYIAPKLRNYTIALGGSKWLCGQFFVSCTQLLSRSFWNTGKYSNILEDETISKLRLEVQKVCNPEFWAGDLKNWIEEVFPSSEENNFLTQIYSNTPNEVRSRYFQVTPLQKYFIEHSINYELSVNLIIWPEFRDSLLRNLKEMKSYEVNAVFNDILDSVVLVVKGENCEPDKMFFMKNFITVINLTRYNGMPNVSFERLIKNGVNYPWNWKVTKTFASKYHKIVPKSIICDIDETCLENILLP